MARMRANPKYPNDNGWQDRHNAAVQHPNREGVEFGLRRMLLGWTAYAYSHKQRYELPIGDDGVLGKHWEEIGDALRGLLNGELGRFDGGTLDAFILDTMRENGVDVEHK